MRVAILFSVLVYAKLTVPGASLPPDIAFIVVVNLVIFAIWDVYETVLKKKKP